MTNLDDILKLFDENKYEVVEKYTTKYGHLNFSIDRDLERVAAKIFNDSYTDTMLRPSKTGPIIVDYVTNEVVEQEK